MAQPPAADQFSLVLGGPLYQAFLRLRLTTPPIGHAERRIAAAIAITWLPVLALTALAGTLFGGTKVPFFHDIETHVRLLIALPLLIGAEPVVHTQMALQVRQFIDRGIVAREDRAHFDRIIEETMRLRNSMLIEIVLLVCSVAAGFWIWREQFASRAGTWYLAQDRLTAAGAWYGFVSLGVFRFLLLRWGFRIALWYIFLWRVSRLKLQLNVLHPDGAGGIGFLAGSLGALASIFIALSASIAGAIGGQILYEGMTLTDFRLEIGAAVVALALLGLAPLAFFFPAMLRAALYGQLSYGTFAMRYVEEFRAKWLQGSSEPVVGSHDIQALADLARANEVARSMWMLPVSIKAIVRFAIVIALPFAPLVLTKVPLNELLARVVKQLI